MFASSVHLSSYVMGVALPPPHPCTAFRVCGYVIVLAPNVQTLVSQARLSNFIESLVTLLYQNLYHNTRLHHDSQCNLRKVTEVRSPWQPGAARERGDTSPPHPHCGLMAMHMVLSPPNIGIPESTCHALVMCVGTQVFRSKLEQNTSKFGNLV